VSRAFLMTLFQRRRRGRPAQSRRSASSIPRLPGPCWVCPRQSRPSPPV
jgi:hypothetical protein